MKRLAAILLLAWAPLCAAEDLDVKLPEPKWALGAIGPVLGQREAPLQPSRLALELTPLIKAEKYREAVALVEKRVSLSGPNPFRELDPALLLLIGQIYMRVDAYDKADTYLEGALRKLPDFVRAHQALGVAYIFQKRYKEALAQISEAVALGGANAELLGYLGYLDHELGNDWGAGAAYEQALMLDGGNAAWQQGLLFSLVSTHRYDSALSFIDHLLENDFGDKDLWLYRAKAALGAKDDAEALTSLEVAIELGESDKDNLHACALLHLQLGSTARAVELLKKSYAQGLDFRYLDETLAWLIREQRWDYAAQLVAAVAPKASELGPVDKSAFLSRRAALAVHDGKTSTAIGLLEQAVKIDPANSTALLELATLYAQQHEYVRAELYYERAGAFDDVKEQALLGHAQMAIDRADYAAALDLLRAASKADPNRGDLRRNIEILESLVEETGPAAPR